MATSRSVVIAVVTLEGVLKADTSGSPIPEASRLYYALAEYYRLILISDMGNTAAIKHWLDINGFVAHAQLITPDVTDSPDVPRRRVDQLQRLRANNEAIGLIIDPNPAVVRATMLAGIPSMLYAHPRYANPGFRPDYKTEITPWSELSNEMTRQAVLKNTDKRRIFDE